MYRILAVLLHDTSFSCSPPKNEVCEDERDPRAVRGEKGTICHVSRNGCYSLEPRYLSNMGDPSFIRVLILLFL